MTRTTLWSSTNGDVPVNLALTNNFGAVTAPGAGSDSSLGYSAGSVWIVTPTRTVYTCVDASVGAAVWAVTSANETVPGQVTAPAAATPTGAGGTALLKGGAGGATSGPGGASNIFGGDATAGNGNGGDVNLLGGAKNGSGVNGVVRVGGIDTVAQGAGAPSALQLPAAAAMDTALPTSGAGDAFDFSVINTSTVDAEDASLTTNAGWTLVGSMDLPAHSAITIPSSGRFRARKTGAGAWTLYRLS